MLRDLHHALRALGRAPGYTLAVILTLALGIGGTTAVFSVLRSVILRPFTWAPADRVMMIAEQDSAANVRPASYPIVGVVGKVRHFSLDTDFVPEVYLPYTVTVWGWMSLVVRTAGDPAALVPAVARAARSVEPDLPLEGVSFSNRVYDLPTSLRQSLAYRRFITGLLGAFAIPAVLLAALGIFGVVAYLVTQRGREIGIRMALGAQRRNVLTLVLAEGMRLAGVGILLGALGAIATTRWLDSELYETSATDPLTFAMAALTLTGISLCAAAIPAQRATAIDPARTLQSE